MPKNMENKQSDIMQTYFFDYTFEFTIMTRHSNKILGQGI
jgi:hypothetical protein